MIAAHISNMVAFASNPELFASCCWSIRATSTSITNGRVMFSTRSPLNSISAVTFTRIAPLSNLTKESSKHATHGSKSVPLTPLLFR